MKMNNENDNKTDALMKELEDHFKATLPANCVAVRIFFNSQGYDLEYETRTAESLRSAGISMRNLRGEFINQ
jgi:hypothetical protein